MTTTKKLGIWMDHSSAHIMEFSNSPIEAKIIESKFTYEEKQLSLTKGESHMHIKEQHQQSEYYKELGEVIKNYDEVILFGPTNAKVELLNILRTNHLFAKIKIEIMQADKMSHSEQHIFIKDYFSKN